MLVFFELLSYNKSTAYNEIIADYVLTFGGLSVIIRATIGKNRSIKAKRCDILFVLTRQKVPFQAMKNDE